jgi:hypothetical protein
VVELKERAPTMHHEKASGIQIHFSSAGHLAMLHFMAHSVDSIAFCIFSVGAKDRLLYTNKSRNRTGGTLHKNKVILHHPNYRRVPSHQARHVPASR